MRVMSFSDFERLYVTPEKGLILTQKAKAAIAAVAADETIPLDIRRALSNAKFITDLPKAIQKRELEKTGTATFPQYNGEYVVIGQFGSIWLDCQIDGINCRISINPNFRSSTDAIRVDK